MRRRRRQQEAQDLVRRFHELPPGRAGSIMVVLVGNAFVSVALQSVLLVGCVRAARRAFRVRPRGARTMAHAAVNRPLVVLICACGAHLVCTRLLSTRWVGRAVRRAENDAQRREGRPSSS